MNFLQKILNPTKNDPFGIDSSLDGIRQLKQRLENENRKLVDLTEKLRDAALDDPAGEVDEMPIVRQREKIKVFEQALEKGLEETGSALNGRMDQIKTAIVDLEDQRQAILRKRDAELLKSIAWLVRATGGRITALPRKGRGGTIAVPAVAAMTAAEVAEHLKDLQPAEPSKVSKDLAVVVEKLKKLTTLRHFGGKVGLETLT